MADFDEMGHLAWRVSRMRDLQRKADTLRPWEATDLLLLEREVDRIIADYFAGQLMPNPDAKKGAPQT